MNTLPKDYVVLGHIKDINVPWDWGHYGTPKTFLPFGFLNGYNTWVFDKSGWLHKEDDKNILVAALPNSPLYNMNLPKKKRAPTNKAFPKLSEKVAALEEENKKLREQLAAISKIIKG